MAAGTIPGANPSGNNTAVPSTGAGQPAAMGGTTNPFLPQPVGQQQFPMPNNSMVPSGGPNPAGAGGVNALNPFQQLGGASSWVKQNDFIKAMRKSGFSAGDAGLLYSFLQSGAGFNPQIAQAMLDAMQPGIQRGQADLLEQFSSMGLRGGSPAAVGMSDFMSQVQLEQGQILSQMYEQSVQNYLQVLMGGKGQPPASTMQNILMGTEAIKNLAAAGSSGADAASTASKI